jgi:hypothetical protein
MGSITFRNRLDPDGPSKTAVMPVGAIVLLGWAPTLTISALGGSQQLTWEAIPFAVDYILRVGTAPGQGNTFNAAIGSTNPTFLLTGLSPGTYFWAVRSVGMDGGSGSGNQGEESSEQNFSI